MNRKIIFTLVAVVILVGAAFVFWKVQDANAKSSKLESEILKGLTEEEIRLVLENQATVDALKTLNVVNTAESRKAFLRGMTEYLALAAKARREGLAEDRNIKLTIENKKNSLLAELYQQKLLDTKQETDISKEKLDEFWANADNEASFSAELEAVKAIRQTSAESSGNPHAAVGEISAEALEKNRKLWAAIRIFSRMAQADMEFMQQPAIALRLKIAEAGILAYNYLNKHWPGKIRVSNEEIKAYLAAHPEYDLTKKREKARSILARVKAGEDFAKLAAEFSEDRATKDSGGVYKDLIEGGAFWVEIQDAALAVKNGQVVDGLVETKDGYHIVQLINKRVSKGQDGKDTVHYDVRHILLQRRFEEPGIRRPDIPPPFLTPEEIAKTEFEKEKRQKFVDAAIRDENISLPEDFAFELTDRMKRARDTETQMLELTSKTVAEKQAETAKKTGPKTE